MTARPTTSALRGLATQFLVDDVERSAEWYRDVLAFQIGDYLREHAHDRAAEADHHHGHDHPSGEHDHAHGGDGVAVFVILERDGQRLMLSRAERPGDGVRSNRTAKHVSLDLYCWVSGLDDLFAEVQRAGATVIHGIEETFYGMREFSIESRDGHVLVFGE